MAPATARGLSTDGPAVVATSTPPDRPCMLCDCRAPGQRRARGPPAQVEPDRAKPPNNPIYLLWCRRKAGAHAVRLLGPCRRRSRQAARQAQHVRRRGLARHALRRARAACGARRPCAHFPAVMQTAADLKTSGNDDGIFFRWGALHQVADASAAAAAQHTHMRHGQLVACSLSVETALRAPREAQGVHQRQGRRIGGARAARPASAPARRAARPPTTPAPLGAPCARQARGDRRHGCAFHTGAHMHYMLQAGADCQPCLS